MTRQGWIDKSDAVARVRQCVLAGVSRATIYAHQRLVPLDEMDLALSSLIDTEYTRHPFYGSRKMVIYLGKAGHNVNRKRVQRLMREMGLAGMAPGPNTSKAHPGHKIYPYLLRGVRVERPNQVWSADITYIRLAHGFAYLVAIIDWYSRCVLSWRISNSMDVHFCVDCLEDAVHTHGKPDIFNTDQGSQFTSEAFTGILKREGVVISMDGRGRVFDNIFVERLWRSVKYEDVYLKGYASMGELMMGLAEYFLFYNGERPHQSLDQHTPAAVYRSAIGGGALIVDKFRGDLEETPVPLRSTAVSSRSTTTSEATAAPTAKTKTKAKPGQRRPAAIEVECTT